MKRTIAFIIVALFLFTGMAQAQSMATMRANKEAAVNVVTFFDDFFSYRHMVDSTGLGTTLLNLTEYGWEATVVGTYAITCIDEMNGVLKITNTTGASDGHNIQWNATLFDCDTNATTGYRGWTMGMRVKLDVDTDQSEFTGGLSLTDTDLTDLSSDGVFFHMPDGQDTIFCVNIKNGAGDTTQTEVVFEDSTWINLDVDFNGRNRLTYRIDGEIVATHTSLASFPNDEALKPSFMYTNGEGVAHVIWIDYFYISQVGKRED